MEASEVTQLLKAASRGDESAADRLLDAVHAELWRLAEAKMRAERSGHTLQPTALVNEAYLRLQGSIGELEDRAHFFGAAARAMERVLVDHARTKGAQKRGGEAAAVTLHDLSIPSSSETSAFDPLDVVEVHDAVEALEQEAGDLAMLVRFRFFVGLTLEQISEIQCVSLATVKRRWTFARAWLFDRLGA